MSTKPGATTHPVASMTSVASPSTCSPTATMTPSCIATSPTNPGRPVPSTTMPPVILRSNIPRAYRRGRRIVTRTASGRALDVVVEVELPRVRAQAQCVDLVLALVLHPRLDDVGGEHAAGEQVLV